ncbi:MAG TPA: pyridoxamine 5'-phosphate oxidase family protein [Pyrinomonadaceae bacterium]|jgi:nitroimidazol reductase NimA-like FMN-containing flavoprotein (pyridoxamine 5'-phosphate oxidase superfamily)|nr:pyridoxamine 5'-phosphate oxidase family protein [Pyrinomonadaceae bacterium]
MITRMSEEEARALLRAGRLARLGCIAEGYPYVVPVNYAFNGEFVFSHSLPGLKVDAMRAFPRVCLQVDEVRGQTRWKSALAFGTFEELKDEGERERALNLLLSLFPQLTPVESLITADAGAPAPVVYRVRVERVTGIREG